MKKPHSESLSAEASKLGAAASGTVVLAPGSSPAAIRSWLLIQVAEQSLAAAEEVTVKSNFDAVGLDSVDRFSLAGELAEGLDRSVSSTLLFDNQTIEEAVDVLSAESPAESNCIVEMGDGDEGAMPLYLLHSIAGDLETMGDLAAKVTGRRVFGLQQSFGQQELEGASIESLAGYYVQALLKHRPEGAFSLAGHSYGARVAYEIARQLTDQGREVHLLGIFDSWPKTPARASVLEGVQAFPAFVVNLPRWIRDDLLTRSPVFLGRRVGRRVHSLIKRVRTRLSLKPRRALELEDYFDLQGLSEQVIKRKQSNLSAWSQFQPQDYRGRITFFRARTQPLFHSHLDRAAGWTPYAKQGVEVHIVGGRHTNMISDPHAEALGVLLGDLLDLTPRGTPESLIETPDAFV
jgi:thioesterase domain-containing protein/acyl carrier protein